MKIFTDEDIRIHVPMAKAISLMKEAFTALSSGQAVVPVRTVIDNQDASGRVLFMPSYSTGFGLFGIKMVSVFNTNKERSLPVIQGRMMIMDGTTGTPLAIMEAEYLTALRTGAASGLATDLLSNADASVLAIFGTGGQAESQVEGIIAVRPIKKILVFGKDKNSTNSFLVRIKKRFLIDTTVGASPEALSQADIICTATTSFTPVFQDVHLKSGVHINAIGSFKPEMQEIHPDTISKSLLVVDHRQAALKEAGDIVIPIHEKKISTEHIHAELGEIIDRSKKGRNNKAQVTVFKSVGNAIQDLAIASCMLQG